MLRLATSLASLLILCSCAAVASGVDRILTIGGGYAPEGNQASLEANVQFFQRVIAETHPVRPPHRIHFADGFDPAADVQVLTKEESAKTSPALTLLDEIFGPPGQNTGQLIYRDHQVRDISGSNRISDVRNALEIVREQLQAGDRLFVYVTAHGGSAKGQDPFDTSITCWGNRELTMREFSKWLDTLPESVPVVLVMAQCYCGGFAHTIFAHGHIDEGLATQLRTGFFAQRHDLPAAGCRPDVENDEEYSSYFWGALIGQSRTGKPATGVDCDDDGNVSLAEAHAYAVIASDTIDIPLCGSDRLLRTASRIPDYDIDEAELPRRVHSDDIADDERRLTFMSGSLRRLVEDASPVNRRIIQELCTHLGVKLDMEVTDLFAMYSDAQREYRLARRGGGPGAGRRGRGGFGRRRDLRNAILERWPQLEDETSWSQSELLKGEAADVFLVEVKAMPAYEAYARSRDDRESSRRVTFVAEMKQVRFQRLIHTLESVVLARNLPMVAPPETVQRYEALVKLEHSFFR